MNRYSYVFNNPLSYTDPTGYRCTMDQGRQGLCGGSSTQNTKDQDNGASDNDNDGDSGRGDVNRNNDDGSTNSTEAVDGKSPYENVTGDKDYVNPGGYHKLREVGGIKDFVPPTPEPKPLSTFEELKASMDKVRQMMNANPKEFATLLLAGAGAAVACGTGVACGLGVAGFALAADDFYAKAVMGREQSYTAGTISEGAMLLGASEKFSISFGNGVTNTASVLMGARGIDKVLNKSFNKIGGPDKVRDGFPKLDAINLFNSVRSGAGF